jgi:hypothetical protein
LKGCLLEKTETSYGLEYSCGYENAPECDYCMYGPVSIHGGSAIDPETGNDVSIDINTDDYCSPEFP